MEPSPPLGRVSGGAHAAASPLAPAIMVHFYRGAMDLATTWRARIDGTTNWAVLTSGSASSFVLGSKDAPHFMALLGMFLAFAFLWIEARRFRFYDIWSGWVRIMETEYFGPLLRTNVIDPEQHWHQLLQSDLEEPHFKISFIEALGRRLRHNYIAIFGFYLLTWLIKLCLHPEPVTLGKALPEIVKRAAIGPLPGLVVVLCVAAVYLALLGLMIFTPTLRGTGTEIIGRNLLLRRLINPGASSVGFNRTLYHEAPLDSIGRPPEED